MVALTNAEDSGRAAELEAAELEAARASLWRTRNEYEDYMGAKFVHGW